MVAFKRGDSIQVNDEYIIRISVYTQEGSNGIIGCTNIRCIARYIYSAYDDDA